MLYTPGKITKLNKNEIFVFGSNESGIHGAGAAKTAVLKFGAIYRQAEGLQGQSYAIPTVNKSITKPLTLPEIKVYVDRYLEFAKSRPDLIFLTTEIGCGLAGLTPKQIAPMFSNVPVNVILPRVFHEVLEDGE